MRQKLNTVFGIKSITDDNKHILLLDFDISHFYYPELKSYLMQLQKDYMLSDFYILKTKNGFNAFTLDKLEKELCYNIMCENGIVDIRYAYLGFKRGYWVLRMSEKKEYLTILQTNNRPICFYDKSFPHYKFFIEIMFYPIIKDNSFDDLESISFVAYQSHKHGDCYIKLSG